MKKETHTEETTHTKGREPAGKKPKKKKKKVSFSTIFLMLILLAGVAVLLYPTVSDWWNSMHATQAIAGYVEAVEDLSGEEKK